MLKPYALALSIFFPLGEYFQIQDDFLNYSALQENLGKVGSDIINNKCSWCIATALNLSTTEQRAILERNYGRKGDVEVGEAGGEHYEGTEHAAGGLCEARVKQVYEAIGLRKVYADYQRQVYRELNERIDTIPEEGIIVDDEKVTSQGCLKKEVFRNILDEIYGRSDHEWANLGLD
ncbi:hypothetical protein C0993_008036 [Termitomyces sp. T159_Od127]|nr:hypothetical protein C0993_008036 [Termitomyces sp. T159_Od127]